MALPFIKIFKESIKKITQIIDSLDKIKIPEKRKSVYLVIKDDKVERFVDIKTRTNNRSEERLKNFKVRLNRRCRENAVSKPVDKKFSCPECKKQFKNVYKLNVHMKIFSKRMCHICKKIFEKDSFVRHVESHGVKIYDCGLCSDTFESLLTFSKHRNKCYKIPSHFCVDCNQGFESAINLVYHSTVHKPKSCKGCGKKFISKSCFINHTKCCNPELNLTTQKYICDYCSKMYDYKNALKVHIMHKHLYGFQFQCEKCGKKFSSRSNLLEHNNTHNRIADRYVCSVCDAKYSTRRGYERHSKKHTESTTGVTNNMDTKGKIGKTDNGKQKIYSCTQCKMKFTYLKRLRTHLKDKHQLSH
ncbi:uncharacterized protein ACR2FA_007299 [Aphomia sociella]